jgi:hypothetical protein
VKSHPISSPTANPSRANKSKPESTPVSGSSVVR